MILLSTYNFIGNLMSKVYDFRGSKMKPVVVNLTFHKLDIALPLEQTWIAIQVKRGNDSLAVLRNINGAHLSGPGAISRHFNTFTGLLPARPDFSWINNSNRLPIFSLAGFIPLSAELWIRPHTSGAARFCLPIYFPLEKTEGEAEAEREAVTQRETVDSNWEGDSRQ